MTLPEGNLKFTSVEFPELQRNTTYLLFLNYIAATSSYFARDAVSNLILTGNNWTINQKSYANNTFPVGTFESLLTEWLGYCGK